MPTRAWIRDRYLLERRFQEVAFSLNPHHPESVDLDHKDFDSLRPQLLILYDSRNRPYGPNTPENVWRHLPKDHHALKYLPRLVRNSDDPLLDEYLGTLNTPLRQAHLTRASQDESTTSALLASRQDGGPRSGSSSSLTDEVTLDNLSTVTAKSIFDSGLYNASNNTTRPSRNWLSRAIFLRFNMEKAIEAEKEAILRTAQDPDFLDRVPNLNTKNMDKEWGKLMNRLYGPDLEPREVAKESDAGYSGPCLWAIEWQDTKQMPRTGQNLNTGADDQYGDSERRPATAHLTANSQDSLSLQPSRPDGLVAQTQTTNNLPITASESEPTQHEQYPNAASGIEDAFEDGDVFAQIEADNTLRQRSEIQSDVVVRRLLSTSRATDTSLRFTGSGSSNLPSLGLVEQPLPTAPVGGSFVMAASTPPDGQESSRPCHGPAINLVSNNNQSPSHPTWSSHRVSSTAETQINPLCIEQRQLLPQQKMSDESLCGRGRVSTNHGMHSSANNAYATDDAISSAFDDRIPLTEAQMRHAYQRLLVLREIQLDVTAAYRDEEFPSSRLDAGLRLLRDYRLFYGVPFPNREATGRDEQS